MRALSRRAGTETVTVEPFDQLDEQGKPSYGASSEIEARAVEATERTVSEDGTEIRVDLTLWIDAGESPLPAGEDRVTRGGTAYLVVDTDEGRALSGELDHLKVLCKEA